MKLNFFFIRFVYLFIATAASRKLTKSLLISIADPVQTENTDCKCTFFRCIYQSCTEIKKKWNVWNVHLHHSEVKNYVINHLFINLVNPEVSIKRDRYVSDINKKISINCVVKPNNQDLAIHWYKDGSMMVNRGLNIRTGSILILKNVQREDTGVYTCEAGNSRAFTTVLVGGGRLSMNKISIVDIKQNNHTSECSSKELSGIQISCNNHWVYSKVCETKVYTETQFLIQWLFTNTR